MLLRLGSAFYRLKRGVRRHGATGVLKGAAKLAWRAVFKNRSIIFRFDSSAPTVTADIAVQIERYQDWNDVPPAIRQSLTAWEGELFEASVVEQMQRGNELWVAVADGAGVACLWSRKADSIRNPVMPLGKGDVAVHSAVTRPDYRGHGIASAMLQHIARQHAKAGCGVFTRCKAWNEASFRMIRRSGFREISAPRRVELFRGPIGRPAPDA